MIDQRRNAAVRIVLGVFWCLLLQAIEIKILGLICQFEFLQDDGDLPERTQVILSAHLYIKLKCFFHPPAVCSVIVGVESEVLAVRHLLERLDYTKRKIML